MKENSLASEPSIENTSFSLGTIYVSEGAKKRLAESRESALTFLCAHASQNWGIASDSHIRENNEAVKNGGKIRSFHRTKNDDNIWIITEPERSGTIVMVPDEF